jgi:hypothetical protein
MGAACARHTPTILNVAYGEPNFWDGRAATLEDQGKGAGSTHSLQMARHAWLAGFDSSNTEFFQ